MVLIFSEEKDVSTNEVIDWLIHFKKKYIRINQRDKIYIINLTSNSLVFSHKNELINLKDIQSVWYRRGNIDFAKKKVSNSIFRIYNQNENEIVIDYIHSRFLSKRCLNNYLFSSENKLEILQIAYDIGLNKADFLVTQSKTQLIEFASQNNWDLISKALRSPFRAESNEFTYSTYTHLIKRANFFLMPDKFVPTFFQPTIDKKFEIRTFYLNGTFYSMVIFSQKNTKTKIDFRHYDKSLPNRVSPFKLPTSYEKKMEILLSQCNINSASIDILVSTKNEYYMIDVNPMGQFGMTSKPCNYNLEKKVAQYLAYEEENK